MLACPAALLIVADAWRWRWFTHPDLRLARDAAEVLWSPQGLHLYAEAPLAQMGPLAIALSPLPHGLYNVVVAALALPVLLTAARPVRADGVGAARRWVWSAASLLLVAPWAQLAWKGHADDALVLVGAAVSLTRPMSSSWRPYCNRTACCRPGPVPLRTPSPVSWVDAAPRAAPPRGEQPREGVGCARGLPCTGALHEPCVVPGDGARWPTLTPGTGGGRSPRRPCRCQGHGGTRDGPRRGGGAAEVRPPRPRLPALPPPRRLPAACPPRPDAPGCPNSEHRAVRIRAPRCVR